jgi:flagellar assembly protein FliH
MNCYGYVDRLDITMPKTIKNQAPIQAQKWQAPVMTADPNRVVRYHGAKLGPNGMPLTTAEEVEQWRKQAEEEGYKEGIEKARQESQSYNQRLQQLLDFLANPLQALTEEIEQQLSQVAVTVAQQLVRRELSIEPGEIIGLIRDSVKLLPGNARNIKIVLNPEDASLVRSALSIESNDDEQSWKIVEDPIITRGGCEIKSDPSNINATLENRLSALAASVLGSERERE